jgi:hypothetical protein
MQPCKAGASGLEQLDPKTRFPFLYNEKEVWGRVSFWKALPNSEQTSTR